MLFLKNLRPILLLCVFLSIFYKCVLWAEENSPEAFPLTIESETALCSAKCKINGENETEDKKRKKIGIGESVILTLTGKNVEEYPEDVEWEITEGENLVTCIPENLKGKTTLQFKAALDLEKQSTVTIQAKLRDLKSNPVTFTIIPPEDVEAKHTLYNGELGCPVPIFDEDGNFIGWYSDDIDNTIIRLSAYLEVTLLPIDVNFQAVPIIENPHKDDPNGGVITYPGYFATLLYGHDSNPDPFYPDEKNMFNDSIGITIPTEDIQKIASKRLYPQKFSYICSYHIEKIEGYKIGNKNILQTVSVFPPEQDYGVIVMISKMGCYVRKLFFSNTEGKHDFGKINY